MIIRGQLHDNSCKKKWFEQLCSMFLFNTETSENTLTRITINLP